MPGFSIPAKVVIGDTALMESGALIKKFGNKALIVTDKIIGKSPMLKGLTEMLEKYEIEFEIFDGITGEPSDVMIYEGAAAYKEAGAKFCIGIGGGSSLDSAKAIAVMADYDGKITDFFGKEIEGPIAPIVAIPTTAGTGSEATKFMVITDTENDVKMLLKGDCLIPDIAVINPAFTYDMPKSVTASTGLDALTHAVEAFTSKKAFELTDVFAISAIKRIMKYLPIAYANGYDVNARKEMALAAYEAGVCINNSSVTIVHGMSRPIGALFHVPHGMSNAMLIADCLEYAMDGAEELFAILGREIGAASLDSSDSVAAKAFIEKIKEICDICEIKTLREYGIDKEEFLKVVDKMASDAVASGSPGNTRKTIKEEDCITIYKKIIEK